MTDARIEIPRLSRRHVLQGGTAVLALAALGGRAFAQANNNGWERFEPVRKLIGETKPLTNGLSIELPLVSEDGSSVPLVVRAERPMAEGDYVRSIHLFATRNPSPEIAEFEFTPRAGRAQVETRVRLNESQTVIAVARTNKDAVLVAAREIRITQSGCLARTDTYESANAMQTRVRVAEKAQSGSPVEVLTLINHPMETGLREGADGKLLPQRIIRAFEVTFDGQPVFKATLHRSIAANPYLRFFVVPAASGTLAFTWTEDTGRTAEHKANIAVG